MSIVTLEEKFLAACAAPSPEANRLAQLLKTYKATTTSFSKLRFCEAKPLLLSELYVGTENPEQRPIDLGIVNNILEKFNVYNVCPILVHKKDNKLLIWDGQHTAVVLLILAKYIFKEDLNTCFVPAAIYNFHGTQFKRAGYRFVT
jgi:hypothetical protein